MARIFAFSSNLSVDPYPVYPLGLSIVAGALVRAGHDVRQFDLLACGSDERRLTNSLAEFQPDIVCYSLRNIDDVDSFSGKNEWYLAHAREVLDVVRRHSQAPIIIGGAAFTIMPGEILDFVRADYGVVGEGEHAVVRLVDTLARGGVPPAQVWVAKTPSVAGEDFATPLWDRSIMEYYRRESDTIGIQTKRGCPFQCNYCSYPAIEGKKFRAREVAAVIADVERAKRDFDVRSFFFTDSVFNDVEGRYVELAEELIRRNLCVEWGAYFRPQDLCTERLRLLRRAGLRAVEFGTDGASDTILAAMKKGFSFSDVMQANEACIAAGVPAAHYVMFGGPDETMQTLAEGLANMACLRRCVVFGFSGIRILPGTGIHRRAIAEDCIKEGTSLLEPVYYVSRQIDKHRMDARVASAFANRRDRLFPPSEARLRMRILRRFGFRGVIWDQLIAVGDRRKATSFR